MIKLNTLYLYTMLSTKESNDGGVNKSTEYLSAIVTFKIIRLILGLSLKCAIFFYKSYIYKKLRLTM